MAHALARLYPGLVLQADALQRVSHEHGASVLVYARLVLSAIAMHKLQKRAGSEVKVAAGALPRGYPFFTMALAAGRARFCSSSLTIPTKPG